MASWADNSISLHVYLANLEGAFGIRAYLAVLFHPVHAQTILKLLDFLFSEDTNLFTLLELPDGIACLIVLVRIRTSDLIFEAVYERSD